jgi:predicted dinucleotide-binding enzyme
VASKAPGARVVKAFNCVGFEVMLNPVYPSGRAVMPIAGDDPSARATVTALGIAAGFEVVDLGGLESAPLVEGFARLWIRMMMSGSGRDFAFGLLKR